jgi:hypothetical protein
MDNFGKDTGKYGGLIREAGGAMGTYAYSKEEQYFRDQNEKKIQELAEKIKENKDTQNKSTNKNN